MDTQELPRWLQRSRAAVISMKPLATTYNGDPSRGQIIDDETEGLPELTGSPKQAAWADKIRRQLLGQVAAFIGTVRNEGAHKTGKSPEEIDAEIAYVYDAALAVAGQTDAGWWIDRRDQSGQHLLREAAGQ